MLSMFDQPEDSKEFYFRLNNSFRLAGDCLYSSSGSISGIYAIFKKGVCYYVGQSGNVASRLATHLSGKYIECDEVKIFIPEDACFSDFYERDKPSQKAILLNNEQYCINWLKPIENIIVSDHKDFEAELLFNRFQIDGDNHHLPCFTVLKDDAYLTVIHDWSDIFCLDRRVIDPVIEEIESIRLYMESCKVGGS